MLDKIQIRHFVDMASYVKQFQTVKKIKRNRYSVSGWRYCLPNINLPHAWGFYSLSSFISIVTPSFDSRFPHSGCCCCFVCPSQRGWKFCWKQCRWLYVAGIRLMKDPGDGETLWQEKCAWNRQAFEMKRGQILRSLRNTGDFFFSG